MNNERRKSITKLAEQLSELETQADDIKNEIQTLKDEEQEYYDNMPESFQNGEKGEKAQSAIDALLWAEDSVDETITAIQGAIEKLGEIE